MPITVVSIPVVVIVCAVSMIRGEAKWWRRESPVGRARRKVMEVRCHRCCHGKDRSFAGGRERRCTIVVSHGKYHC